jgi:hypothetical protein
MLFVLLHHRFPRRAYWGLAFLVGAVAPTVVALVIVLPLKGQPVGGGWGLPRLLTAVLCNGAWGVGTGLIGRGLAVRFNTGGGGIR